MEKDRLERVRQALRRIAHPQAEMIGGFEEEPEPYPEITRDAWIEGLMRENVVYDASKNREMILTKSGIINIESSIRLCRDNPFPTTLD